jgi:hypothetical protein
MSRKNSVDSTVSNGSFNGLYGTGYVLDSSVNTYEIYWTNKKAYYLINDELLHTLNASTTPSVSTPSLPCRAECNNGSGNTANNSLVIRSLTINRLGEAESAPIYAYAAVMSASVVVLKYSSGRLHRVIINQLSGNNADRLTLYDGTSATNTFAIFNTNQVASIGAITYGLDFYNGLSYIFNGSGGTPNVTFIYE